MSMKAKTTLSVDIGTEGVPEDQTTEREEGEVEEPAQVLFTHFLISIICLCYVIMLCYYYFCESVVPTSYDSVPTE